MPRSGFISDRLIRADVHPISARTPHARTAASSASSASPRPCRPSAGRLKSACASASAGSPPAASTRMSSSPPSPGNSLPSCGPSPGRCRSRRDSELQAPGSGPRRGPGVAQPSPALRGGPGRPSCLDRGRRSTETSKVVTNPRISAGSTVGITGPASVPARDSRETAPM